MILYFRSRFWNGLVFSQGEWFNMSRVLRFFQLDKNMASENYTCFCQKSFILRIFPQSNWRLAPLKLDPYVLTIFPQLFGWNSFRTPKIRRDLRPPLNWYLSHAKMTAREHVFQNQVRKMQKKALKINSTIDKGVIVCFLDVCEV